MWEKSSLQMFDYVVQIKLQQMSHDVIYQFLWRFSWVHNMYKNSLTPKAGLKSCILMLACVIHIKCQQMSHAVWFGILVKVKQNGSTGTCMLFKFLIFSHVGYTSVEINITSSLWTFCYLQLMCGDCDIPGFSKLCLLHFLYGISINGACFNTWCSILI
jgi:hypothetical protein